METQVPGYHGNTTPSIRYICHHDNTPTLDTLSSFRRFSRTNLPVSPVAPAIMTRYDMSHVSLLHWVSQELAHSMLELCQRNLTLASIHCINSLFLSTVPGKEIITEIIKTLEWIIDNWQNQKSWFFINNSINKVIENNLNINK